jgi:plastocyanin
MRSIAHRSWQRAGKVSLLLLLLLSTVSAIPTLSTLSARPAAPVSPPPVATTDEVAVQLAKFKFGPADLSIVVGTTVVWSNSDAATHNVAIDQGPELFVSQVLEQNNSVRLTFTKPGKYHYFCEWHPEMQGNITVASASGSTDSPPAIVPRLFAETGKTVRGTFLDYWQSHGALPQQGFPISEEIEEKSDTDGKFYDVQYFERAVFEMHPENKPPYDVLLSLLGNFQYKQKYPNGAPGQQANTSAGSVLFKETGKRVGGKFLEYWNKNGGLAQQGFPISEEFMEKNELDGKTYRVQYFERAVFEMHPENKPPYDVLLSQLGKFRYQAKNVGGSKPTTSIYSTGISSGAQHYPLLAGPHAAAGVNAWIYDQDPKPVVGWVNDLGVKWVLHQLSWYQLEPEKGVYRWDKLDPAVNALKAAGVNIILHPVHAPIWAWTSDKVGYPKDPADFARFMSQVAQRYKGKVSGYQIWNEPNFAHETGPHASASHYAAILKAGYTSVKAVDPQAIVISGALTATGVNDPFVAVDDVVFLKRLYAYNSGELKGYFDVLGVHPGSNANPPDTLWPEKPGPGPGWTTHASFYFRRLEQLRQVMVENGDAHKQIWLTEFGWASTDKAAPGFEYAEQVSEQEQADYLAAAFRMGRDRYPWMGPMLVFGLNFSLPNVSTDPTDERIAWSILRRDGSKRPSYFAVKDYAAGK